MTDSLRQQGPEPPSPGINRTRRWLMFSLLISLLFSGIALSYAFSHDYVIQDDARHHVFWMHRFLDPTLFPDDLIANYFQTVAPLGYVWLYKIFAWVQVDPITLNKVLPLGLGLVMTAYCFGVCMELWPVPLAAFASTLLLNEWVWAEDNLISATPRAFVYPIFLGFLYYFMKRSLWPCLLMILLQGLFYPQYALIIIVFLLLNLLPNPKILLKLGQEDSPFSTHKPYLETAKLCGIGVTLACSILLIFKLTSSGFGPVVTLQEAQKMIEFTDIGRFPFFDKNPWCFWLSKKNSGLLSAYNSTVSCRIYVGTFPFGFPPLIWLFLGLPLFIRLRDGTIRARFRQYSETSELNASASELDSKRDETPENRLRLGIIGQVIGASLVLFFLAHLLLLTLHLPARYTVHSFRIVMALMSGITLALMWRGAQSWALTGGETRSLRKMVFRGLTTFVVVMAIAFPLLTPNFAAKAFAYGREAGLYEFMAAQPKDILVASLSEEADNIPIFSKRSVLINRENAIPFHRGFYDEFSQRSHDLLAAQYTTKRRTLKQFIKTYGVDFWVIDDDAFEPTYLEKKWVQQYQPTFRQARRLLLQESDFVLPSMVSDCTVFKGDRVSVLETQCILN